MALLALLLSGTYSLSTALGSAAGRLLEDVASEANLALALLNVVRNKGAPGVDGQTVDEAEANPPPWQTRCC